MAETRSLIATSLVALGNWRTVIGATMTRQVKGRFQSNQLGLLLAFAEPFLLLGMIMILRVIFKERLASFGLSEMVFLSSGIFPYYMFVRMSARSRSTPRNDASRRPPRVSTTDMLVATIMADLVLFLVPMIIWFTIMALAGLEEAIPHSVAICAEAVFFVAMFGIGLGLLVAAISSRIPIFSFFYGFIARLLIFLTGVFYVVDVLPLVSIRDAIGFNPLAHGVIWFRLGLYGNYPHYILDTHYMMLCSSVALFVGVIAYRGTMRPARW